MNNFLRLLLWFGLTAAAVAATGPMAWPLPAISGNLSGVLTTTGMPDVQWQITTAPATAPGRQHLLIDAQADRLSITLEIEFDPLTHDGSWRLTTASVDAAIWLPVLADKVGFSIPKDLTFTGIIHGTGVGGLHAGIPDGALTVTLRDGTLVQAGANLSIDGISADLHCDSLQPLRAPGEQVITFHTATAVGLSLTDGRISFSLPDMTTLKVAQASVQVLGGRVEIESFVLNPAAPDVEVRARFLDIGLEQVQALLPPDSVAEARGSLSGRLDVGWSAATGLGLGEARLREGQGEATPVFRLAPSPGLLSAKVPPKIPLLGKTLSSWVRGAEVDNPVYTALHEIELGQVPLRIETLRLRAQPDGDTAGHTAGLELTAQPVGRSVVDAVNFDLKVRGPLAELLHYALDRKLTAHGQ